VNLGVSVSVAVAMASCAVPRSCAGGIFTDTSRRGSVDPGRSPAIRRLRRAEVDFDRVFPGGRGPSAARAADRLTLNLFPDVCLAVVRDRATDVGGGRVQWEGHVPGASPGTMTLIVDHKLMVGTIRIGREVYEIGYLGDGVHAVMDIDPSKFPRD
jgi:hypothetical protein